MYFFNLMELLSFLLASILLASGLVVITARNPIHSVLFMILVFLNVAFILISLKASFLALTFIIVYVGAVAVLFLFVVMMLNIKITELSKELIYYLPIGGMVGFAFLFTIFLKLLETGFSLPLEIVPGRKPLDWFSLIDDVSNIEVIGNLVYTYQFFYFILSGLVLLVAMIGAIVLTVQKKDPTVRIQQPYHQLSRSVKKSVFLIRRKFKRKF